MTSPPKNYRELEKSIHIDLKDRLSYGKYLHLPEVLNAQHLLSDQHDEMLFIVIHQTYELWFKQILHEVDATIGWMDEGRMFRANHSLKAINKIEKVLVGQIHGLESMAQIGFLEFRDKLNPASGFQSMQFRESEFSSGAKDEKILKFFEFDEFAHERLQARYQAPSLADAFWSLLEREGFDVSEKETRMRSIVKILSRPETYPDLFRMQDLLIDHDENIALWRYHHVLMVERMLGMKKGTGGSAGAGYLRTTLEKKFFPEIWEARTYLEVDDH